LALDCPCDHVGSLKSRSTVRLRLMCRR
jgi:hypothetical protein